MAGRSVVPGEGFSCPVTLEGDNMDFSNYLNEALAWARMGFDTVNSIQGLVIALIAAVLMSRYNRILVYSLGATVVHELVNVGRNFYAGAANPLPDYLDLDVLKLVAIRFIGYLIAISLIYLVRRLFFRG
ncbi:MAG: hypothetical protein U0942_02365 [Parvibaculum sp.]|uniref:hypothetical protein n=1 Tax=Parvibaculum sp. TaxID=2024848 RepID=UPI002ABC4D8B|nr:hypothetical protein [Parvibaculum sp.]MDZ4380166.1 hypothetical protein [Parvibaculum sp.]